MMMMGVAVRVAVAVTMTMLMMMVVDHGRALAEDAGSGSTLFAPLQLLGAPQGAGLPHLQTAPRVVAALAALLLALSLSRSRSRSRTGGLPLQGIQIGRHQLGLQRL